VQVPGDGNCLFHTLGILRQWCLPDATPLTARQVRAEWVSLLRDRLSLAVDRTLAGEHDDDAAVDEAWADFCAFHSRFSNAWATGYLHERDADNRWMSQPTRDDRDEGRVHPADLSRCLPPVLAEFILATKPMEVMTVFTHFQNGWPRFQRVPVWFAVEKASISCSFRRRKLAALATTFVWVSSVLSREGRYASVEVVTPFLVTLPPRIIVATITKPGAPLHEPVVSVEDAKEPSHPNQLRLCPWAHSETGGWSSGSRRICTFSLSLSSGPAGLSIPRYVSEAEGFRFEARVDMEATLGTPREYDASDELDWDNFINESMELAHELTHPANALPLIFQKPLEPVILPASE
jgi:hypothetical protein